MFIFSYFAHTNIIALGLFVYIKVQRGGQISSPSLQVTDLFVKSLTGFYKLIWEEKNIIYVHNNFVI